MPLAAQGQESGHDVWFECAKANGLENLFTQTLKYQMYFYKMGKCYEGHHVSST